MEEHFWMAAEDGTEIFVRKWGAPKDKPKAVIQLSHGMMEHSGRYAEFAEYLVGLGYAVYGNDHRGHGKTGEKQGLLGYFGDEQGFMKTVGDLYGINRQIENDFPGTPVFLFGHSMGSFLSRIYIQKYSGTVAGTILSGTASYPMVTALAGKTLASLLPPKKESRLMNKLAFGSNNRRVTSKKNGFSWLSRDEREIEQYIDDPFTGFVPTSRFFYDLLSGIGTMQHKEGNRNIRKDLPLLLISGDADPVGDYGKGVWKAADGFQKAGLLDITVLLYADGRHEILHEINKDEAFRAIGNWISENC